ncbi:ECF transporter S component [Vagococcus intermedius]|uniref:ECF transporter S component n=1 Tax=Vagococcus intermedius TaxID=2991418 RepID=A0AAF0I9G4_9ENTE|nr:ECF transporter S component [Vagococcus intermedius]WEG73412.1 ECF transporter S component [Vagococcus intermedius]WEG75495.1 ECF transporter S component [Vagococcus intermedius]
MKDRRNKTYRLTIRAILTAIILIQGMVPFLGFIPLGLISLTIVHITVIIAAITLGTKDGMFIGLMWGLTTLIRAWTMPTTPMDTLVFTNPIISVLPRVIVGLVTGVIFTILYKKSQKLSVSTMIAAALGTLTNTFLVLGLMGLLYTTPVAESFGTTAAGLWTVLGAAILTNGVPEIIAAVIITPIIVKAIFKATSLSPDKRD